MFQEKKRNGEDASRGTVCACHLHATDVPLSTSSSSNKAARLALASGSYLVHPLLGIRMAGDVESKWYKVRLWERFSGRFVGNRICEGLTRDKVVRDGAIMSSNVWKVSMLNK